MKPLVEIVGIDHIQVSMPAGQAAEAAARTFYGGILGLREVPKPAELAGRGGVWFASNGVAVHAGIESPFVPAARAHPALTVRDLDRARAAFVEAGVPIEDDDSGLPVARCYVRDPFGNRIELVDERDAGFSDRV
jgi:catechol 2,3-dioxygenase-like lactoylglutathione lyase family enzyme